MRTIYQLLPTLLVAGLVTSSQASSEAVDVPTTVGTSLSVTETTSFVKGDRNRQTGLVPDDLKTTTPTEMGAEAIPFDEATMMRAEDVRPGMKGYGLSVFSGIAPEKFEAEVVGVRHRVFADQDIILCMLKHPALVDIGVIAGMSGSPVYINGKLIGAVAYGWTYSKEPLAGITPIDAMLRVYNNTPVIEPAEEATSVNTYSAYNRYMEMRRTLTMGPAEREANRNVINLAATDIASQFRSRLDVPDTFAMKPLATPLLLSSAAPATLKLVEEAFAGYNVQPVSASMVAMATDYTPSFGAANSPGGAVADLQALADEISGGYGLSVPFVEGDLNMAGVGTVTYRKGNRLVAFGHPMFEQGVVDFPMAPARINGLVRNIARPFKLGEPLGQVGVIRQDRQPAIGAVFGQKARMYDLKALIHDPGYHGKKEFNYRLWNDRDMGPMLAMTVLVESLVNAGRSSGDSAALFNYTVEFDDGTSYTKEDYTVDQYGGMLAAMSVGSEIGVIMNNPYKRVRAKSVNYEMRVADRLPQAQLLTAELDRTEYRPGETVMVEWELQPYRKPVQRMTYSFRLPENLSDGPYSLKICDSRARSSSDSSRSPGGERIYDYDSLVRALKKNYPGNKVYVTMEDRDTGVAVRGNEMPKLPASVINTIKDTVEDKYFETVRGNFLVDADIVTHFEVSGTLVKTVQVRRQPQ